MVTVTLAFVHMGSFSTGDKVRSLFLLEMPLHREGSSCLFIRQCCGQLV